MVAVVVSDTLRVSLFTGAGTVRTKPRVFQISQVVKAQSFREEGRWGKMVDGNGSVLRKRIDEVKMKERLERCWTCGELGWNYHSNSNSNSSEELLLQYKQQQLITRRRRQTQELSEMAVLVFRTMSITFMSGTAFLCLASLLIHLHHHHL